MRLRYPALHDVILPDDLGLTQVDHLVRLPHGIAVLETKALSGWVSGSADWRQWTQHLQGGRVRATFQNPLRQNFRHTEAVGRMAGAGVPVLGLVVATGSATFCPELKDSVVQLANLAARLAGMSAGCCDQVRLDAAWCLSCRRLRPISARSCVRRTLSMCAAGVLDQPDKRHGLLALGLARRLRPGCPARRRRRSWRRRWLRPGCLPRRHSRVAS